MQLLKDFARNNLNAGLFSHRLRKSLIYFLQVNPSVLQPVDRNWWFQCYRTNVPMTSNSEVDGADDGN
jgi:hypothetical protein